jgi:hypothetical protein
LRAQVATPPESRVWLGLKYHSLQSRRRHCATRHNRKDKRRRARGRNGRSRSIFSRCKTYAAPPIRQKTDRDLFSASFANKRARHIANVRASLGDRPRSRDSHGNEERRTPSDTLQLVDNHSQYWFPLNTKQCPVAAGRAGAREREATSCVTAGLVTH